MTTIALADHELSALTTSTTQSLAQPTHSAGHLLIAVAVASGGTTPVGGLALSSGWSLIHSKQVVAPVGGVDEHWTVAAWWRFAPSSSTPAPTLTRTGGVNHRGYILAFSGVDNRFAPVKGPTTTYGTAVTGPVAAPGIPAAAPDWLALTLVGTGNATVSPQGIPVSLDDGWEGYSTSASGGGVVAGWKDSDSSGEPLSKSAGSVYVLTGAVIRPIGGWVAGRCAFGPRVGWT